jgi:DNA-binding transcriptional regulator YiaG
METNKPYGIEVKINNASLQSAISNLWKPPSSDEIKAALSMAGWSGVEFSKRVGVTDRTVRRWISGDLIIPYAPWCILCMQAGLGCIW